MLIVEDIVDTGLTSAYLLELLQTRGPASVRLCSLLHKPARMKRPVTIDYLGFTIEDVFVVGYGLDYGQRYRNLPDLITMTNESMALYEPSLAQLRRPTGGGPATHGPPSAADGPR